LNLSIWDIKKKAIKKNCDPEMLEFTDPNNQECVGDTGLVNPMQKASYHNKSVFDSTK